MATPFSILLRDAKRIVEAAKARGLLTVTGLGTAREADTAVRRKYYRAEAIRHGRKCRDSGLSKKALGSKGYGAARRKRFKEMGLSSKGKPFKRRWSGLSAKDIGHPEYMRQWRALRRERGAKVTQ